VVPTAAPPASRRLSSPENLATALGLLVAVGAAAAYFYFFTGGEEPAVVARLSKVTGTVSVTQVGSDEWEPAELGASLQAAQKVRTGPRSGATISFIDGSIARIQPDSVVLVGEPVADVTAWTIRSGEVSFDARERSVIVTANARAVAAANSTGAVDIDAGGESGFRIFEGSAEVQPNVGEAISLSANEGVIVDNVGRAGPKLALPDAPELLGPPSPSEQHFREPPEATAQLTWSPSALAASYHVGVDYNVTQDDMLLSAAMDETGITEPSHELAGLVLGDYFWRVAAVNEGGMEGRFSRVARFKVVEPPEPELPAPALVVHSAEAWVHVAHIAGRIDPGASLTLDGHPVKVRADGSFDEFFKHERPNVLIRVIGVDGQLTEQQQPLTTSR